MTQPLPPCPTCNKRRWWYRSKAGLLPMCPTLAAKGRCPGLVYRYAAPRKTQRKNRRRTVPLVPLPPQQGPRYDQQRLKATCPVCGDPCEGVCASCTARGLR